MGCFHPPPLSLHSLPHLLPSHPIPSPTSFTSPVFNQGTLRSSRYCNRGVCTEVPVMCIIYYPLPTHSGPSRQPPQRSFLATLCPPGVELFIGRFEHSGRVCVCVCVCVCVSVSVCVTFRMRSSFLFFLSFLFSFFFSSGLITVW